MGLPSLGAEVEWLMSAVRRKHAERGVQGVATVIVIVQTDTEIGAFDGTEMGAADATTLDDGKLYDVIRPLVTRVRQRLARARTRTTLDDEGE